MDSNHDEFCLPNKIYDDVLKDILKHNLNKSTDNYELVFSAGSAKGDNYMGVIHRVQVIDKATGENKLNLIVKLPPQSLARRNEMSTSDLFRREADFYDNVYPMYKKFQEEKGIDVEKDGFHHIPYCYKTLIEEPYEGLYFEDLNASGFEMFDRLKEVTKEHVFLVMKSLAKMHAVFYSIKDQKRELIEPHTKIKDIFLTLSDRPNSPMTPWFDSLKKQALEVINKSQNKDMIQKIENLLENNFSELLKNCLDLEKTEPYAVLCHGDCWNNNVLFKYDKNRALKSLRLLDFQIMRYSSPCLDLMYYIFCCTTKSLRDKHYQDFLNVYYVELCDFIQRLGSDPNKLFPHEAFLKHLKQFGKFGFIMAMIVLPIFTSDASDIPDMDELAENFKKIGDSEQVDKDVFNFTTEKTFDRYAERMIGVCDDMYALGYI
ncbi:unnamed protein product [Chironomus riparius]|uniref:CHK kinase-like domain-containing protein n=1 Tax=Chironomus riparius TaxID=315576 RepID=A0A9N9RTD3_9DIPT|nr:unnamed protein product [Chironomus riparius]